MQNATAYYKNYSPEDKAALKELRAEMSEKVGKEVNLADAVSAVEPEM